jgi:tRNA threonylcarbamoyl adenosine modification protein (Sua5/YciO/YrdC/YwlC family)
MIIKLYDENTNPRHLAQINECLLDGGVIIYPTDSLYAFGCDIFKQKAIERIARIKQVDMDKNTFSIICQDLSQMADYAKPIANHHFKIINRCLPGPFTFILEANNKVPKHLHRKKKQVGIRIPDNKIAQAIIRELGNPLISTSIPINFEEIEYSSDPELIYEQYQDQIDIMIDAGYGEIEPSTIVDFSSDEMEIIREGKGSLDLIY